MSIEPYFNKFLKHSNINVAGVSMKEKWEHLTENQKKTFATFLLLL